MKKGTPCVHSHAPEGTFAYRVQNLRLSMNMTQQQVEDVTGIDRAVIAHAEIGDHRAMTFENVIKLARGMDVSLDYLAGFQKEFGTCPCPTED